MTMRKLQANDFITRDEWGKIRHDQRRAIIKYKQGRRLEIGPFATVLFENFKTMRYQVQEMLYIEGGGEAQLAEELNAYNPLIPDGNELVATVLFEIENQERRRHILSELGNIETHMFIRFAEHQISGVPEADLDRTDASGKASSVQFIHFPFTQKAQDEFVQAAEVMIGFDHPSYHHIAVLPAAIRANLVGDFAR